MTAAGKVPPAKVLVVSKEGHSKAIVFISVAWVCISFTVCSTRVVSLFGNSWVLALLGLLQSKQQRTWAQ
jgi:hypothetical protein